MSLEHLLCHRATPRVQARAGRVGAPSLISERCAHVPRPAAVIVGEPTTGRQ